MSSGTVEKEIGRDRDDMGRSLAAVTVMPGSGKARLRRALVIFHLWTGLILGLWFAAVGLTGSVMAWMPQLLPREIQMRFPYEKPGATFVAPSVAVAAMKAAHPGLPPIATASVILPGDEIPYYLFVLPNNKADPASFQLVLVDPTSGRAYPPLNISETIMGWIVTFHTSLTKGAVGTTVNGTLALLALPLLVSGVWLWWPRNLRQLRLRLTLRYGVSRLRTLYDLHNMMGIYLLLVVFTTTLTAVLMVAETLTKQGITNSVNRMANQSASPPITVHSTGEVLPLDTLAAHAKAAVPGAELSRVALPAKPDQPFHAVFERGGNGLLKSGEIDIDPHTGNVLRVQRITTAPAGQRFMQIARDLHFGTYGGVATQVLYSVAGLMPCGLFVTGLLQWLHKFRAKRTAKRRPGKEQSSI